MDRATGEQIAALLGVPFLLPRARLAESFAPSGDAAVPDPAPDSAQRARAAFWIDDAVIDTYALLLRRARGGPAALAVYTALARPRWARWRLLAQPAHPGRPDRRQRAHGPARPAGAGTAGAGRGDHLLRGGQPPPDQQSLHPASPPAVLPAPGP
ncbi:MAG: hypothetical protein R2853_09820 [Thermomicrobiales bacterium]